MTFDPNAELVTQEDHDAYVQWCAAQLLAAADEPAVAPRVYATAMRAASWLWVVAQAQIHLDDDVEDQRDGHQQNLAKLFARARLVERAAGDVKFSELLTARIALDCFEPVGQYAHLLLDAARLAIDALELIFIYPPIDKWDLYCPGPWSLIFSGAVMLEEINDEHPLTFADYSVRPSPGMVGKVTWDAANRVAQRAGAPPISPN
jgi:hypothetical protein